MTYSGIGTDVAAQVIESHSSHVMGNKCSCYVHGFSGGFWPRMLSFQPQKKPLSLLPLLACAQVTNMHSVIVEAVAGMVCSLQGLDH